MILSMGVRTIDPMRVAYKTLGDDEDEASATARFLAELTRRGITFSDETMIVYHGSASGNRRELLVPVDEDAQGAETRTLQPLRVAFLVFTGPESEKEVYYQRLRIFVEHNNLSPHKGINGIEISYAPADLDEEEWKTELMIPLAE